MSEETDGEKTATRTIAEELNELGRQLGEAFRAAWQSEERQELQRELKEGLNALGDQLEAAVESARKSEALGELKADLKSAAESARKAVPLEDIRGGLVKGLQKLNSELSVLIEKWLAKPDSDVPSADESGSAAA